MTDNHIENLIKKIESEKERAKTELHSEEGLERLQQVAQNYNGEYRLIWSDEILEQIKNRPQKTLHKMNMPLLDDIIGGLREQQMIGIAAHSGHGKTAMGLFFLKQYESLNPVMIPLEQSNEELIEQRLSNNQFVPRFLSPARHSARVRPEWIEERIVEGIAKYNTKLVVIDHLGYIDADPKYDRDPDHLRIERKLQELKNIAKRWNVIIVVLIHITQLEEGTPPSLVNLKGSAAIRQECDKVILLWRKNQLKGKIRIYTNDTLFSVQKNRWNGRNGNAGLQFHPENGEYTVHNDWVADLEKMAEQEMAVEDEFNSI